MHTISDTEMFIIMLIAVGAVLGAVMRYAPRLSSKGTAFAMGGIILLGFSLRLAAILLIPCEPISDYNTMFTAAQKLAAGDNSAFAMGTYFQRFPHMTVFPALAAFLMKVFGSDVFTIKIFSVLLKTAAVYAAGLVGRELAGKRGMLAAAFLYAVFPADIYYTPVVATENFALTFLVFSLYFYIKAFKAPDIKRTIINISLCGLILSAGCLLRGVAPFYLLAYCAGIILLFTGWRRKAFSLGALAVCFVLVFQLVSLSLYYGGVSEYKLSDKGEPYTVYMLVGSNFDTNGMWSEDHNVYLEAGQDPEKASAMAIERLKKRLSDNPERILPLLAMKTGIIWGTGSFDSVYWGMENNGVEGEKPHLSLAYALCSAFYKVIILLSVLAAVFYKKKKLLIILGFLPLAFQGGLMLMEIQPRYTYSVAYVFTLLGSAGVCGVYENVFEKRKITLKKYLRLARVHHYIKNLFVFLPLFFSMQIFNIPLLIKCVFGFIAFSLVSSAIYVINDLRDAEKDRLHPEKCRRPIASGEVSARGGIIFAGVLAAASVLMSILACGGDVSAHGVIFIYFILNLVYSFGGKDVPIVDIAILASGFLLRLLYGAAISGIEISGWLYLTVIAISFYLGLGKRRNELGLQENTRAVLKFYTYEYLDKMMYMFMAVAIVFYSLWCVDPITVSRFSNGGVIWTVPIVILICMRYSLIVEGKSSGDPVDVILKDKLILPLVGIYAVVVALLMYL